MLLSIEIYFTIHTVAEGEEMLPKLQTTVHKSSAGTPSGVKTLIAFSIRLR